MDYSVKELPKEDRPREKLKENGVKHLTDTELVSLVIRSGISGKNVKELSSQILNQYSLVELAEVPILELKKIRGISDVKAGQLKAISELAKRLQKEERTQIENFTDLRAVVQDLKYESREKIRLILLKSSNEIIDMLEIEGHVDSVKFEIRDVLNQVISRNAAGYIICHNHPSGDSTPTDEDIKTTEALIEASNLVSVQLLDHVIVGEEILSMKGHTCLEFG